MATTYISPKCAIQGSGTSGLAGEGMVGGALDTLHPLFRSDKARAAWIYSGHLPNVAEQGH